MLMSYYMNVHHMYNMAKNIFIVIVIVTYL